MDNATRLDELLARWRELCKAGPPPDVQDVCTSDPDLLDALRDRIQELTANTDDACGEESYFGQTLSFDSVDVCDPSGSQISSSAEEAASQKTDPRAGKYQCIQELARGGMGIVFRGFDPEFERALAIKVMRHAAGNPIQEKRFFDEARITGYLQHPAIPPVYDVGRLYDGRPYFAMKYIEGRTLSELLRSRQHPLEELPRYLTIFEKVCHAITYAHVHGVIHRDLKPGNVMVGAFGEVQVMDWGLARQGKRKKEKGKSETENGSREWGVGSREKKMSPSSLDGDLSAGAESDFVPMESKVPLTLVGQTLGTPAFMAPEQARGNSEQLDHRCDIFGLGAILCVVLTGKPPFDAERPADQLALSVAGDLTAAFERLDQCGANAELVRLTKRLLAPEVEDRPLDACVAAQAVGWHLNRLQEMHFEAQWERRNAASAAPRGISLQESLLGRAVRVGAILIILLLLASILAALLFRN